MINTGKYMFLRMLYFSEVFCRCFVQSIVQTRAKILLKQTIPYSNVPLVRPPFGTRHKLVSIVRWSL